MRAAWGGDPIYRQAPRRRPLRGGGPVCGTVCGPLCGHRPATLRATCSSSRTRVRRSIPLPIQARRTSDAAAPSHVAPAAPARRHHNQWAVPSTAPTSGAARLNARARVALEDGAASAGSPTGDCCLRRRFPPLREGDPPRCCDAESSPPRPPPLDTYSSLAAAWGLRESDAPPALDDCTAAPAAGTPA